jgi:hypothetical protein
MRDEAVIRDYIRRQETVGRDEAEKSKVENNAALQKKS